MRFQSSFSIFFSKSKRERGVVKVSVIPFENPLQKPITTFLQMKWTKVKKKNGRGFFSTAKEEE